jgi:methylated-DNA-[protein]-cysteine S-methyltransferase
MPQLDPQIEFNLFPTAIGRCGIAWGEGGILAVQLPDADVGRTRSRLLRSLGNGRPGTPPPAIQRVIDDIAALFEGQHRDLRHAVLDMTRVSEFQRRVYLVARAIEPGQTLSYGEVAALCGDRQLARAVGQALGHNPFPIIVPCHRVLAAGGKSGGFSAPGGVATKRRLLSLEPAALFQMAPPKAAVVSSTNDSNSRH